MAMRWLGKDKDESSIERKLEEKSVGLAAIARS